MVAGPNAMPPVENVGLDGDASWVPLRKYVEDSARMNRTMMLNGLDCKMPIGSKVYGIVAFNESFAKKYFRD